jgi:electron transfer flavoprotein alpha subunit
MTRPTFGRSLLADILCPTHRPQMATVCPGAYLPDIPIVSRKSGLVIPVEPPREPPDAVLLQSIISGNQPLSAARRIVAGGKGIGSREGFRLLEQLAAAMGAAVGASRAAVNAGYAPYPQQIGLTGQTVRPCVYLAFGISGAVQHLVGMEKSDLIIAVNTDPRAPIFEYADYGIVGDWQETAEELLRLFQQV